MKELLKKYQDLILMISAIIILAALAFFFFWSMFGIVPDLRKAVSQPPPSSLQLDFNLDSARKLDLRGLVK